MGIKQLKQTGKNTWALDVRYSKDGKQYRKREIFEGGKQAAQDRYHEIRAALKDQAARSLKVKEEIRTFGDAIRLCREKNPPNKAGCYLNRMESEVGHVPIEELPLKFDDWLRRLRRTTTINHYIQHAHLALNLCVRFGLLKYNPIKMVRKLKVPPRDRALTDDEKTRLLEAVSTEYPYLYPLLRYSLAVPCRRRELLEARRCDYDEVNNQIRIRPEISKTREACIKPVPPEMTEYFRSIPDDCEWLFYRKVGSKYRQIRDFRRAFETAKKIAGVEGFIFRDTRRTSYTDLVLEGNNPKIVQAISGHRTDMSRVYCAINGMQAAKAVKFRKPEGRGDASSNG